jgi:hypothetical protein
LANRIAAGCALLRLRRRLLLDCLTGYSGKGGRNAEQRK